MKRVLFDANVVLDVLLARQPFVQHASTLWKAAETGRLDGVIAAHCVTTIDYLARRAGNRAFARRVVADLLSVFGVAPVDKTVLTAAHGLDWADFEDAVCASAAAAANCDTVVTRDPQGFPNSLVMALDPAAAVAKL